MTFTQVSHILSCRERKNKDRHRQLYTTRMKTWVEEETGIASKRILRVAGWGREARRGRKGEREAREGKVNWRVLMNIHWHVNLPCNVVSTALR